MIVGWLKGVLITVVVYGALGITAAKKVFTEDYRPWKGDSLTDLSVVRKPGGGLVRVHEDSPEVLSLFVGSATGQELRARLTDKPFFEVASGTKCKVVARSELRCAGNTYTSVFVRVRISSGQNRGKEGVLCDAQLVRTMWTL